MRIFIYILILVLILSAVSCGKHDESGQNIPQNVITVNSEIFHVSSYSTGLDTYTKGTVFVKTDDAGNYYVQIAAWIEIGPLDRGGVAFAFPFGWEVTGVTCNYSDFVHNSEKYIETTNGDEYLFHEWGTRIAIGCSLPPGKSPSGGGKGSIVIELQQTSGEPNPYPGRFETFIGVGYKKTDYYFSYLYPDYERIGMSLFNSVPDLGVELGLDKPPVRGEILQLTCTASLEQWNDQGVSETFIDIMLPEAFELIDGDLSWSGDIGVGGAVIIQASIKAIEIGTHEISANVLYSFSKYRYIKSATIYLGVFDDRGFISSDERLYFETSKIPISMTMASPEMKSILQLETSLSESLGLNIPIEVTCIATAIYDVSEMKEISINWDEGFEFLEGNPLWQGGLAEGEQVVLTATLLPVKTGRWRIHTECNGTFHFDRGRHGSGSAKGSFTYDNFTIYIFKDGGALEDK